MDFDDIGAEVSGNWVSTGFLASEIFVFDFLT